MGDASSPGCALVVTSFACSAQVPPDCQCCPVTVLQASGPPPGACLLLPCLLHCLLAALSLCSPAPQHTGLMLRLNKSYTPDKHHPCTPISLLRNRLSERCGVRSGHARAKKHVPTAGSIRSSLIGPVQPLQPCVSTRGTISLWRWKSDSSAACHAAVPRGAMLERDACCLHGQQLLHCEPPLFSLQQHPSVVLWVDLLQTGRLSLPDGDQVGSV